MAPTRRESFIAGIVVACVASGLLFSTLIFSLVRLHQRVARKKQAILCHTHSKRVPSLDYSLYFQPLPEKPQLYNSRPGYPAAQGRDSSFLSPATPDWLTCPLMLPPPPTRAMHVVDVGTAGRPLSVVETCPATNADQPLPVQPCYSPSVYLTPSWRNSTVTLFEEDIRPVGLGIWQDVDTDVGGRTTAV